jgi:hypothetical protein
MNQFTIDQAGKIEESGKGTILSLCTNEIQYTIKIPSKLKQDIFNQCKKRYKNNITFRIFSYGLSLILENKIKKYDKVIIDNEYPGHENDIKGLLLNYMKGNIKKEQIKFDQLGKKDSSHRIAYQTFCGKLKPNDIIDEERLNLKKIVHNNKLKEFMK